MITVTSEASRRARARELLPLIALAVWTLLVWVSRIRNVLADDDLTGNEQLSRIALAASFVVLGSALALLLLRQIVIGGDRFAALRQVGLVLAIYGIAVWLVQGTDILAGDYSVGFKAIHTALAIVTIALGTLVIRGLARAR